MGGLELSFRHLILLDALLELAVGELLECPQVLPVVAGALLQSLLHLQDLPARASDLRLCPSPRLGFSLNIKAF